MRMGIVRCWQTLTTNVQDPKNKDLTCPSSICWCPCSVNTPTVADCKLLTWRQLSCRIPGILTISACELVGVSCGTPVDGKFRGLLVIISLSLVGATCNRGAWANAEGEMEDTGARVWWKFLEPSPEGSWRGWDIKSTLADCLGME